MACANCQRPDLAAFDDATLVGAWPGGFTWDDAKVIGLPSVMTGAVVGGLSGLVFQSWKVGVGAGVVVGGLTAVAMTLFVWLARSAVANA